jgi:hypothetical protein
MKIDRWTQLASWTVLGSTTVHHLIYIYICICICTIILQAWKGFLPIKSNLQDHFPWSFECFFLSSSQPLGRCWCFAFTSCNLQACGAERFVVRRLSTDALPARLQTCGAEILVASGASTTSSTPNVNNNAWPVDSVFWDVIVEIACMHATWSNDKWHTDTKG